MPRPECLLLLLAVSCAAPSEVPRVSESPAGAEPPSVEWLHDSLYVVDTLATGLSTPWGLALTPNGDLLVTEREGRLSLLRISSGELELWRQLAVREPDASWNPESGLLGVAASPNFPLDSTAYVVATRPSEAHRARRSLRRRLEDWVTRAATGVGPEHQFENQIIRVRRSPMHAPHTLVRGIESAHYHAGGALIFGPDGFLYASSGDALQPAFSADPEALAGKILRYDTLGRTPLGARGRHPAVYALGLRNSQGIAWHAPSSSLFAIEHGPTGLTIEAGRTGNDELNVIREGGDYGWPRYVGYEGSERYARPIHVWNPAIAPAGVALHEGSSRDTVTLFVTSLQEHAIRRLTLVRSQTGWRVVAEHALLSRRFGRLRAIVVDRDGTIYAGTSNRDGRGVPGVADDLLLRITPRN